MSGTVLPNTTSITFTPGFRTHIDNHCVRGGVDVPATHPQPFDYPVLATVMKSWRPERGSAGGLRGRLVGIGKLERFAPLAADWA